MQDLSINHITGLGAMSDVSAMGSASCRGVCLCLRVDEIPFLEGQRGLGGRLVTPITYIVTLVIPIMNLLTKPP